MISSGEAKKLANRYLCLTNLLGKRGKIGVCMSTAAVLKISVALT